jgi:protein ImuB
MPVDEAEALVRELVVQRYELQADYAALLQLAEMCDHFSPCVALEEGDEPESLLMDISNLTHLLGSDATLAARVEKFFTRRRYHAQIAVADTIGLAWAVAHYLPAFDPPLKSPAIVPGGFASANGLSTLTQLPIESLRIHADTADLLRQLGIQTVTQLLALPRESLAPRFGEQLLLRLDQLLGAAPEVLVPHHGLSTLEVGCNLDHPAADRATLLAVLSQLAEQLAAHLAARDQGAVLLVCQLRGSQGPRTHLRIGLVEPSASAQQLIELIGLHLESVRLADEVTHVEIQAAVVGRLGSRQRELFADRWPSDPHQLAVLINRLSSRLGSAQVVRPQQCASPLPERAFRYRPAAKRPRQEKSPRWNKPRQRGKKPAALPGEQDAGCSAPCPLLLYPQPHETQVICVAPDGLPQVITLEHRRERIVEYWGPERIETLWWRGTSARRDYYRIATESGGHWWIFRQLADGRWFLHGIFA